MNRNDFRRLPVYEQEDSSAAVQKVMIFFVGEAGVEPATSSV